VKELSLTKVGVVTNWLARRVITLNKQVHPGWEYCRVQDLTCESSNNIEAAMLIEHLKEVFQNINSWLTPEQVHAFHIQTARYPVRQY
jgi:hypothetical protein